MLPEFTPIYQTPSEKVRVCNRNTFTEAQIDNAKMTAGAFVLMIIFIRQRHYQKHNSLMGVD